MFTGDDSGKWLYRALHKAGLAKSSGYQRADDNELIDTCITAVAHCAPPENKPTIQEIANCRAFLKTRFVISQPKVVLALGSIAWKASIEVLTKEMGCEKPRPVPTFSHLAKVEFLRTSESLSSIHLVGSYHPSRQNTNTRRLTEPMFDAAFELVNQLR
jgi:uracil-DNA glycosylase family 4